MLRTPLLAATMTLTLAGAALADDKTAPAADPFAATKSMTALDTTDAMEPAILALLVVVALSFAMATSD